MVAVQRPASGQRGGPSRAHVPPRLAEGETELHMAIGGDVARSERARHQAAVTERDESRSSGRQATGSLRSGTAMSPDSALEPSRRPAHAVHGDDLVSHLQRSRRRRAGCHRDDPLTGYPLPRHLQQSDDDAEEQPCPPQHWSLDQRLVRGAWPLLHDAGLRWIPAERERGQRLRADVEGQQLQHRHRQRDLPPLSAHWSRTAAIAAAPRRYSGAVA